MNAASMICLAIYFIVALMMIGIGVSQLRSKTPVAFYSGEKPYDARELSDVAMWNKKHGMMWILYGIIIMFSYGGGAVIGLDSGWCVIPMAGGLIVPVLAMIWYHHRLIRRYKR